MRVTIRMKNNGYIGIRQRESLLMRQCVQRSGVVSEHNVLTHLVHGLKTTLEGDTAPAVKTCPPAEAEIRDFDPTAGNTGGMILRSGVRCITGRRPACRSVPIFASYEHEFVTKLWRYSLLQ